MRNTVMIREAFNGASLCADSAALLRRSHDAGPIGNDDYGTSVSSDRRRADIFFVTIGDLASQKAAINQSAPAIETSALNAPSGINAWSPPV